MYVCICKGITDRQIESAVHDGARTMGQLRRTLGVATQCGKCRCQAGEILREASEKPPLINGLPQYTAVA